MDRAALRREAIGWFRTRLAADDWMDALRSQTRLLRPVPATGSDRAGRRRPKRAGEKIRAA
jgi:hypothetical protein